MAGALGLILAACGGSGGTAPTATLRASASTTSTDPCSSVKTTTPIEDVPTACAALWAPYGVTKVPPVDILQQEHVPAAPPVANMTGGAVSQQEAQAWANASNRGSGYYEWAEANGQLALLSHLVGTSDIAPNEEQALAEGAVVYLPACDLFPLSNTLYPITAADQTYFARKHLPTEDPYVLVARFAGPCSETIRYPNGASSQYTVAATSELTFEPGMYRDDPALGSIWFTDGGGNCEDPAGPPAEWCNR